MRELFSPIEMRHAARLTGAPRYAGSSGGAHMPERRSRQWRPAELASPFDSSGARRLSSDSKRSLIICEIN